jgi:hypothetical protein
MQAEFILKPSEIKEDWIKGLKELFKGQAVEMKLVVTSLDDEKSKQAQFKKAVKDIRNRSNLVSFTIDEFAAYSKKLAESK